MHNLPWDLVRTFLVVARCGSLSAAARELEVSQPTVSRNVQALESGLDLNLFRRTTQGLALTDAGQSLVEAATRMDEAADLFARQASGLSVRLEGNVRISANEIVGFYLLPPALAAFRERHPGIQIEVVISNRVSSLSKREADIALRMFRPSQPDLIARRLPDLEIGFFAHRDYVSRHGAPTVFDDIRNHAVIGFDEDLSFIEAAAKWGYKLTAKDFALRTDDLLTQINLIRASAGVGVTHLGLAQRWPELQRLLEDVPLPALEFWVVCHSDVRFNTRIQALMRFLGEWFSQEPYARSL